MAKQRKRGGRVTPKGTPPRGATSRSDAPTPEHEEITHQRDLPGRVRATRGFGGRPITHNRGNR